MALPIINLCFEGRSQDCSTFTVKDESEYGVDGADARGDHAQYFFPYKMDELQQLTEIEGDFNATPLTTIEWTLNSAGDGAYRIIYIFAELWNNVDTYAIATSSIFADVVFHNNKLWKAVVESTNSEPTAINTDWEEISPQVLIDNYLILNPDTVTVHIHSDILTCKYEACLRDELDDTTDAIIQGKCNSLEELLNFLKMQVLLDGANSNNWQDKQERSEFILVEANKKFCNQC